jgi:hypothetical protein
MWAALSSGQPVGERYKQRFFEDVGAIGIMKRCFGVLMLVLIAGFYLWDIGSNYSAFTGGRWVPVEEGTPSPWARRADWGVYSASDRFQPGR